MRVAFALTVVIGFLVSNPVDAQNYHWSHVVGDSGSFTTAWHTVVDDAGNVYTLGTFSDTLDLDPTAGVHTVVSNGLNDVFVQRINADGTYGWGYTFGTFQQDEPHDLALDAAGRLVVMGYSPYSFTIANGGGSYAHTPVNGYGLYLFRFSTSGQVLDGATLPGGTVIGTRRFGVAPNGDYVIGGSFRDTRDFDPGPGIVNATSLISSSDDFYLLRLSDSFAFQWVKNSFHAISFNEFDFDSQGNILVAGNFVAAPDFDPGPGNTSFNTGDFQVSAGYVAKYTSLGDFVWAKGWYSAQGSNACGGLAIDAEDNIYAVGNFNGIQDFDAGGGISSLIADGTYAGFLLKLATNGALVWAKEVGQRNAPPMSARCNAIEWTGNSTLLVAGSVDGSGVDVDPGPAADSVWTTPPGPTAFILELDTAANLQTRHLFDGSGSAGFNDLRLNAAGEIAGAGLLFPNAVDMDPSSSVDSLYAPLSSYWGAFVVKFGTSPLALPTEQENEQVRVFPNPGANGFTVVGFGQDGHLLLLVDGMGREVLRAQRTGDRTTIDCSALAPGLFVYRLLDRSGAVTNSGKWIKE